MLLMGGESLTAAFFGGCLKKFSLHVPTTALVVPVEEAWLYPGRLLLIGGVTPFLVVEPLVFNPFSPRL